MEELIQSVKSAEAEAAERKARALSRASEIVSEAEETAGKLIADCEKEMAALLVRALGEAKEEGDCAYRKTVGEQKASAVAYAEELLKNTKAHVSGIVRRIAGDC